MTDIREFKPKTIYVTYIAATPEKVWQALTDPAFSRQYFAGFAVDVEPKTGGAFRLLYPDGRVHISRQVLDWSPPRRFSCTWVVEGIKEFAELPECLVTYDIEPAGEAVKLTMTESHSWDVPDAILAGGQHGLARDPVEPQECSGNRHGPKIEMAPPPGFMEAVKEVVAKKPWLRG